MNPNSALRWLPPITAAGLLVPRTTVIPYKHHEICPAFDGEDCPALVELAAKVDAAAAEFPGPVFIRTDLGSAKHSGPKAYKVDDEPCGNALYRLLEDQEMKFWTAQPPEAILVREFLTLEAKFEAFSGLPVNREFRVFSAGLHDLCLHAYWPHTAVEEHVDESKYPNWRADLSALHELSDIDRLELQALARQAVLAICRAEKSIGFWSVDFAQDVSGKWYLIDMATARDSFHWPGCEKEGLVK